MNKQDFIEIQRLKKLVETLKSRYQQAHEELEALRGQIGNDPQQALTQVTNIKKQLEAVKEENKNLAQQLVDQIQKAQSQSTGKESVFFKQIDELKKANSSLENQLATLNKEKEQLLSQTEKVFQEAQNSAQSNSAEIEGLKKQIVSLNSQLEKLKSQAPAPQSNTNSNAQEKLKHQVADYESKIAALNQQLKASQADKQTIAMLNKQLEGLEETLIQKDKKQDCLEKELNDRITDYEKRLDDERKKFEAEIEKQANEYEKVFCGADEDFSSKLKSAKSEILKLQESLSTQSNKTAQLLQHSENLQKEASKKDAAIDSKETQIQTIQAELSQMRSESEALKAALQKKNHEYKELFDASQKNQESLKSKLKIAEERLLETQRGFKKLQDEDGQLRKQDEALKIDNQSAQSQVHQLKMRYKEAVEVNQQLQIKLNNIEIIEKKNKGYEESIKQLNLRIVKFQDEQSRTQQRLVDAQEVIEELKQTNTKLEASFKEDAQSPKLIAQIDQLKKQVDQFESQQLNTQNQQSQQKKYIENLLSQSKEDKRVIQSLEQIKVVHRKIVEEKKAIENELCDLRKELASLKAISIEHNQGQDQLTQQNQQLKNALQQMKERSANVLKDNLELKQSLETSTIHYKDTAIKLSQVNQQKDQLEKAVEQLNANKETLERDLSALKETYSRLVEETKLQAQAFSDQTQQYEAVCKEKDALREKFEANDEYVGQITKELHLTKQTIVRGLRETKELEARYFEMMGNKVQLANQSAQMKKALEDKQETIDMLSEQSEINEKRLVVLEADSEEKSRSIFIWEDRFSKLSKEKNELESQVVKMKARMEDALEKRSIEKEEKDTTYQQLLDAKEKIITLENINEQKDRFLQNKESEFLKSLGEKDLEFAQVSKRLEQLVKQSEYLEELKVEKEALEEKYMQLREELQESSHKADESLEVRIQLHNELEDLKQVLQQKETSIEVLNSSLQKSNAQLEHLQSTHVNLEADSSEKDHDIQKLKQHLAKKVKELSIQQDKIEMQKATIKDLQQDIQSQEERYGSLEQRLGDTKSEQAKMQKLLDETIKSLEKKTTQSEDKYLKLFEKHQNLERRYKEMENYKSQYEQLHQLVSGLGTYLAPQIPGAPKIAPSERITLEKSPNQIVAEKPVEKKAPEKVAISQEQPSLFGASAPGNSERVSAKEGLFD